jgi:hypothetical protein
MLAIHHCTEPLKIWSKNCVRNQHRQDTLSYVRRRGRQGFRAQTLEFISNPAVTGVDVGRLVYYGIKARKQVF